MNAMIRLADGQVSGLASGASASGASVSPGSSTESSMTSSSPDAVTGGGVVYGSETSWSCMLRAQGLRAVVLSSLLPYRRAVVARLRRGRRKEREHLKPNYLIVSCRGDI